MLHKCRLLAHVSGLVQGHAPTSAEVTAGPVPSSELMRVGRMKLRHNQFRGRSGRGLLSFWQ